MATPVAPTRVAPVTTPKVEPEEAPSLFPGEICPEQKRRFAAPDVAP